MGFWGGGKFLEKQRLILMMNVYVWKPHQYAIAIPPKLGYRDLVARKQSKSGDISCFSIEFG